MTDEEKIALLEDMMDLEEGDLSLEVELDSLEEWDSMSKLALVVLAKKEFAKELTADDIRSFSTVADICEAL